jgi:hypothetical protein
MSLALLSIAVLRTAIRRNLVSFPAQAPAFTKGDHRQKRIALLYFVRGWEVRAICERYGLTKATVRKAITDWTIRAVAGGYIQEIYPPAAEQPENQETAGKVNPTAMGELKDPESFLPAA